MKIAKIEYRKRGMQGVFVLMLLVIFIAISSASVFGYSPTQQALNLQRYITTTAYQPGLFDSDIDISGQVPKIINGINPFLRETLEMRFSQQTQAFIQTHGRTALRVSFSTDFFTSGDFVSIVINMKAESASTTQAMATTVIDAASGRIISLTEFDPAGVELVNNYVRNIIARNPRDFTPNFNGISSGHGFFLDGDRLIIPFNTSELATSHRGVELVQMNQSRMQTMYLERSYFMVLPSAQYSAIMINLQKVASFFGYELNWIDEQTIEIYHAGVFITSLTIGQNSYFFKRLPMRTLEAAPLVYENRVYVPLSFFDEILGMSANFGSMGRYIIFTKHNTW
jgi:hypothetical protein